MLLAQQVWQLHLLSLFLLNSLNDKNGVLTSDIHMLAHKQNQLIGQLIIIKQPEHLRKSDGHSKSMNTMTPDKSTMRSLVTSKRIC